MAETWNRNQIGLEAKLVSFFAHQTAIGAGVGKFTIKGARHNGDRQVVAAVFVRCLIRQRLQAANKGAMLRRSPQPVVDQGRGEIDSLAKSDLPRTLPGTQRLAVARPVGRALEQAAF